MPPLPPVTGVVQVILGFNWGGDVTAQSRMFIKYTGTAPTAAQLNSFCTSVATGWNTNMPSLYSAGISLTSVRAIDLSSATAAIGSAAAASPGTRAGHAQANQVCANWIFQIARRYRGGKPKMFIPGGMSEDLTTGNLWTAAYISAFNTGFVAFQNAVLAAGWTGAGTLSAVNVSYFQGFTVVTNPVTHRARNVPTLRATPLVDAIITQGIEDTPAIQRRRSLGRA